MLFLKRISVVILFLFSALAKAEPSTFICLTGRIVENLPSYGETFVNSANLAIQQTGMKKSVVVKKYFYDDRPLSPISAYHKMIKDNCSAIIGFEYLSDLMLVTKVQKNEKTPIFTSYASTLGKNNFPKNIFIFMPSYRFLANKMLNFSIKKFEHLKKCFANY